MTVYKELYLRVPLVSISRCPLENILSSSVPRTSYATATGEGGDSAKGIISQLSSFQDALPKRTERTDGRTDDGCEWTWKRSRSAFNAATGWLAGWLAGPVWAGALLEEVEAAK